MEQLLSFYLAVKEIFSAIALLLRNCSVIQIFSGVVMEQRHNSVAASQHLPSFEAATKLLQSCSVEIPLLLRICSALVCVEHYNNWTDKKLFKEKRWTDNGLNTFKSKTPPQLRLRMKSSFLFITSQRNNLKTSNTGSLTKVFSKFHSYTKDFPHFPLVCLCLRLIFASFLY